ncbi:MAG: adenylate/guanylate cyclase domain-containing protein [Coriobacteriia bacterium]|nr:adenylate/guanylate cyclase domain-containing protein [Coriobacteriia bacterium]
MAQRPTRRNERVLPWIRAAAYGSLTTWALLGLNAQPFTIVATFGAIAAICALFAPGIAVLVVLIAVAIPVLAANLLAGAVLLVVGFASLHYLTQNRGLPFMLILAALMAATLGPAWAVPVIAGYLLGASEGAVVAILACLLIQAAGLATGSPQVGLVLTSGTEVLLSFEDAPSDLIGLGWLADARETLDPAALLAVLGGAQPKLTLLLQPLLWAVTAAGTGLIANYDRKLKRIWAASAGVSAGIVGLAVGTMALASLSPALQVSPVAASTGALTSLVIALVVVITAEYLFSAVARPVAAVVRQAGVRTEDADVDELLRVIATAEDQLASEHTVQSVVMITDMKSFSKMTEEDGSVASAKTIQRHRDLLLPIITEHGGSGKSTGGDGLVAAFGSTEKALQAAVLMQRALKKHNAAHACEREIIVRIGLAEGEVILDKSGRPFIGAALNLAARIMDLGDGGQILTDSRLARSTTLETHSHGEYALKNIAGVTEVIEVLWESEQAPVAPARIAPE